MNAITRYVIMHIITGEYVYSHNDENIEFEYVSDTNLATIFDSNYVNPDELFMDEPDRLNWKVGLVEIEVKEYRHYPLDAIEQKIKDILCGNMLSKDSTVDAVLGILGTDNKEIVAWVNRNFTHTPKVGDWVCYHADEGGMITTRGHKVTKVSKDNNCVWLTNKKGAISFAKISEDMDGHLYDTGELNPEKAKGGLGLFNGS